MYCPNCSTQADVEQKFCRSCGMELQAVGELIRDQVNIATTEEPKEEFFHGNKRALVIWGMILTFVAIAFGSSLKLLAKEHIQLAGEFTPYLMVITLVTAFWNGDDVLSVSPDDNGQAGIPKTEAAEIGGDEQARRPGASVRRTTQCHRANYGVS